MAERKWGAITSGATFESLAATIVRFEDPGAWLFARRGKDGGQDARSSDGTRVFQAKYHENGSATLAIRDAKSEAKKIEEYRRLDHSRREQWNGVTHWRLITNAAFNPTDKARWDTEVVPLFARERLVADYWERATLDGLLDKHPEIHRSFFENETRVFLSIPEVKERLPDHEPFLRRNELGAFCGRKDEKATIREFLASERLFLVVQGAGGTGKTRLLVESGEEIANDAEWQVFWANVESMSATSAWFDAVVPERATLLLVDEPSNALLLQQLAEQLGGRLGRAAKWKVVVAVRSPKDPVLRFLRGARMKSRVQEMTIAALPSLDAEAMCFELLKTGKLAGLPEDERREAARQLSTRFAGFPVWLTLAVQHLDDHGSLKQIPTDAEALAEDYLREIESGQSEVQPETVRSVLQWVALVGTFNREDDASVKLLGEASKIGSVVEVRRALESLVRRHALVERGARNRFVELKPDVLRDHVLLRWLARNVGGGHLVVASDEAETLLESVREAALSGTLSEPRRAILLSLSRTEFLLRLAGYELSLTSALFEALKASLPTMSASQRVALADVLEPVAPFHPRTVASLIGEMRRRLAPDEKIEGIFRSKVVGQADVLLSLAWPLFGGAMGAESSSDREAVLRELCALAEEEAELAPKLPRGLPNDGMRAASLVTRVLEGGPQFWSEYDDTAKQLANELIEALTKQEPTRGQIALLKSLVEPILDTERRQGWSDERTFTWRTFAIVPGSAAWSAREAVLARIREALEADVIPPASRAHLWQVFSRVRDGAGLERLRWTHAVLTMRQASLEELAAAREVWDWYRHYEKDPEIKEAADKLEALYTANALAKEFQPLLLTVEDWEAHDTRVSAKASDLASVGQPREISDFIERAIAFLGGDQHLYRFHEVAWALGAHAESSEVVRQFVAGALSQPNIDPRSEFALATAVRWVATVRTTSPTRAHVLVRELLAQCGNDDRRAQLLERVYGRVPKLTVVGEFTAEEVALLRGSRALFLQTGRAVEFIAALALTIGHKWSTLYPLLDEVLGELPQERLPRAMQALVYAVYSALRERSTAAPAGLAEWLMNQLLALPDFGELGGNTEWYLTEILRPLSGLDVRWLPEALERRQQLEKAGGDDYKVRAISHRARLSKYVRKIEPHEAADSSLVEAVDRVLAFVGNKGTVGHYLPEILRDIDPLGLVVPSAVVARAESATGAEDVRQLARIGGAYPINTAPWRTIALATIRAATPLGSSAVRSVHGALGERGIRSWGGTIGEVPPIFIAAVAEAQAAVDTEIERDLRPYWQHRLSIAEAELRDQEQRAKEERGE